MGESTATTRPVDAQDVIVKCSKLTKVFNDFWMRPKVKAVDGIDLDIYRGEVFGLLGPNGSGKSTTIKMLLGLLHPTSGRIAVFGRHPRDVSIKSNIGYLPEESYLYPFLNARETLDYYGRLFHQASSQRRKRIDMLLEMVGLERVARRPVGEYSKGMARRIGLAQALINDPQLLILDEPTTGMDPIGTADVKRLIQTLARRGKTVLLCSHLLSDVEDVCDRVAVMYGGSVQAYGTVDELLEQQHTTTIQTDELDDTTLEQVEQVLSQHGKHINRVAHPRQRLEELFLDIVSQAKQKGRETSGAQSGGTIASFLEHGDNDAENLIENLTSSGRVRQQQAVPEPEYEPGHASPKPAPQLTSKPVSQPTPEPDEPALELSDLVQPAPPVEIPSESQQPRDDVLEQLIKQPDSNEAQAREQTEETTPPQPAATPRRQADAHAAKTQSPEPSKSQAPKAPPPKPSKPSEDAGPDDALLDQLMRGDDAP